MLISHRIACLPYTDKHILPKTGIDIENELNHTQVYAALSAAFGISAVAAHQTSFFHDNCMLVTFGTFH